MEEQRFTADHPRSAELFEQGKRSPLAGVPMPWMAEWAGPYPIFVAEAHGGELDVDGHLTSTFASVTPAQWPGTHPSLWLPRSRTFFDGHHDDASVRGLDLARRRTGASLRPYWQFALTATDANRFTIRLAPRAYRQAEDPCGDAVKGLFST